MLRSLVGSEMCIRDRYQRRVRGPPRLTMDQGRSLVLTTALAGMEWGCARETMERQYGLQVKECGDLFVIKPDVSKQSWMWANGDPEQIKVLSQSRGTIFTKQGIVPVCWPFEQFWSYNEPLGAPVARAMEASPSGELVVESKMDGSLFKMFFHGGRWRVASHFEIEPVDMSTDKRDNFTLFYESAKASGLDTSRMDPTCCYMFERIHPEMRIVVPYYSAMLVHIGTRRMNDLVELDPSCTQIGLPRSA
eukprot:TRINITY_DN20486_c0_g2_i1.p1 TRINITY_DN20486_c0_g2~~TRINITY_DN20486_c0_g2_i1.p1  ORF type:complete len:249 (-),score=61.73 TRINITY_DN20486_c0_g2_i1:886-1632(-)